MSNRFIDNVTPLNAATLNQFETELKQYANEAAESSMATIKLTTITAAEAAAKAFGNTPSGTLNAGDELELTFMSGNTAATPIVVINGTNRVFRLGGNGITGQTMLMESGAKLRCWWDGTYLQLYGNQNNFPTASQTVTGGTKMWMSAGGILNISTI